MVMDKLGDSLQGALRKLIGANRIDENVVNEVVKDIQRALLTSDVNVKLVMDMSKRIKDRSLKEEPEKGADPREHVVRIVYQEMIGIMGKGANIELKPQTIMMVGLQGSGKTTSVAKLARFFQKKGLKPAVIGADNFRPGAYQQLKILCDKLNVHFYGEEGEKDAVAIVERGLKDIEKYDIKIIDTAGRHALEADLIAEMEAINDKAKPDQKFLVLDAAIGQQAGVQAKAFNDSVGVTGIIITKLDGTAKGGGALSAVSEIGAPIAFIGTGETPDDFEKFDADRFISRLLGMGDLQSLLEKVQDSMKESDMSVENIMKGRFTLNDMYAQLEAMNKMGPLKQIMKMLPLGSMGLGGAKLSDKDLDDTGQKMKVFKVIMDSMTEDELNDPKIISAHRISRIARGSGRSPDDIRELLKYHKNMQNAFKNFAGKGGGRSMQKMMKKGNMGGMGDMGKFPF
ncbi:signal recognition particle protein Srp54 [Methanolapillus millepedarum]|uniref:Signal recognition particle 54 kDa protein n=1 Tax=Methanolapillus millepedarum TaxID=3028296 RepID=A0AA96ZVM8_9EURY|nr:Signal recognition particle protein [Methanosarcinaceae archaeon Ac7]